MTGDLLDGARAKRLLRREGRWYLEVERLVAVDPCVFRPTLQRIEGREGILWFLTHHNSDADLERSARGVFDTTSGAHATFESAEGTWVPSTTSTRHFKAQARKRRAEVETYWRQQRELGRLRVENDELKRRLAKLERVLYSPGNPDLRLRGSDRPAIDPSIPAEPSASSAGCAARPGARSPGEVSSDPVPDAALAGAARAGHSGAARADAVASGNGAARGVGGTPVEGADGGTEPAAPDSVPPPEPDFEPFEVPRASAFERCLAALVGSHVDLEPSADAPDWSGLYAARLLGDDDRLRGVMLADAEAVARLGGLLLMLPEPEVQEQVDGGAPSQDALEAMSEVFNTLTTEFNNLEGSPHLRSRPVAPVEPGDARWFKYARNRAELRLRAGGLLVVLAR